MIITELTGGLGNQLFQLSNGLVIAKNNDVVFHAPNYSENIKTIQQYSQFAEEYRDTIFRNIPNLDVQPINVQMQVVNNQQQHFQYIQPPYHENYINIYKGYFQSEKFFQNQEELLKNYFHNQDLINKFQYIKNLNYASLHIKRGNCLNLQMQHLILPKEYYDVAVSAIKYDKLLIFSNDINWCKENLDYPNIVYIEEKDYISLYMMSQCTSHIIANSTFSWWGAKFSEWYGSPDKILTPDVWFGPTLSDLNTNDIIPDRWTKIKC